MTQKELSKILHSVGCPVNEGVSNLQNEKSYPRIDYWEIAWEDVMASGDLDIVAQILSNMDPDKAALIMAELDSATAAKVTKMMVSGETTEAGN